MQFLYFFFQKFDIDIILAGGFVHPEVQGIYGQRNIVQLFADQRKVLDLIVRDLSIPGDLDQPVCQRADVI